MKKTIFSTLLVSCILCLTSCSSNDNSVQNRVGDTQSDYELSYAPEEYDYAPAYYVVESDDESECDDESVDLTADVTYYTTDGNIINISRDSYGNISGHDTNGNFYGGYSDEYGYTTMHDSNGNYTYSYTDDYGYTSGHDLNGNYYSGYTDDFGNTTITIY